MLAFSGYAFGENYYCTLRTSGPSSRSAPILVHPHSGINSTLTRYMLQTMDSRNPYTLFGIETHSLDIVRAYEMTLQVDGLASPIYFKLLLNRGTGLIVRAVGESHSENVRYEFIGSGGGSPASISIKHRNGWATHISCGIE